MWIILDIIIAGIFIFFIVSGVKKGFIKSCLGLVVTLLSIAITISFHAELASYLRDTVVYNNLKENLKEAVEKHIGKTDDASTVSRFFGDVSSELPEFGKIMEGLNVDPDKIAEGIDNAVEEGREVTVDLICEGIVEEAAEFISTGVAIILLFIASIIVLTLLVYLLNLIFKLPVLNFANRTLGFVIGFVKALLFSFVIIAGIKLAIPYLDGTGIHFDESDMETTVLFSAVDSINPIKF